jgi:hypothetical protein
MPKNVKSKNFYPVIGYTVRIRERETEDGGTRQSEEIGCFLIVNEKNEVGYIYPSLCNIYLDPSEGQTVKPRESGNKPA